ncbi:Rid family hydrolase [Maribacter sp. TH_r10]|uniref:Rid family hydrolase n=1 Tax=Maribacter sp. TH_r10 TaxID=3082086 RepID=UPI0029533F04|nr:Rid family hydrolase [Maribacter sp. TH_r10]MDV7139514.1 Rid family hydrolase [Maribacter sp. TH_r10]
MEIKERERILIDLSKLTEGEIIEMKKLGILTDDHKISDTVFPPIHVERPPIEKHVVHAPHTINEAYDYQKPSSFSRALRLDLGDYKVLVISGTASVNEKGKPEHIGDFKAQLWRTYYNITNLLEAEGMTWHDVVRTTNYLRDIERDYGEFNKIRTSFYNWLGLDPLPAATGIQARLCWETLLVEIEAYAVCKVR